MTKDDYRAQTYQERSESLAYNPVKKKKPKEFQYMPPPYRSEAEASGKSSADH